jgi:hypothetical protein
LRQPERQRTAFAFPVRLVQFQVALVYLVTGYLKLAGDYWRNGEALYYVLQLESIRWPPGTWLWALDPGWLLSLFTWLTILFELAFMPMVFAPFWQPALRAAALVMGAALHVGIGVTLAIPDFSLVMMISYLLFFEPSWVEWIKDRLPLNYMMDWVERLPVAQRTDGHSDQEQELAQETGALSRYRYYRRLGTVALLGLLMVGVIWWNLVEVVAYTSPPAPRMPDVPQGIMWYSGLWQYWDLFAPLPLQIDGRITVPGGFEDNARFDLYAAQTVRPMWGPEMRWRKFEENINNYRYDDLLREWGRYYCRLYNETYALPEGKRLATLEIRFVYRRSHPPGGTPGPLQDDLLWTHWCYEEYRPEANLPAAVQAVTTSVLEQR